MQYVCMLTSLLSIARTLTQVLQESIACLSPFAVILSSCSPICYVQLKLIYSVHVFYSYLVGTSVSQTTLLSNDTNELKVSMSSSRSYQCTGQRSVVLHGGVTMTTTDLHYRAFGSTDDSGFNSEGTCRFKALKYDSSTFFSPLETGFREFILLLTSFCRIYFLMMQFEFTLLMNAHLITAPYFSFRRSKL